MRTIPDFEFEAKCLEILDESCRAGEEVEILKQGRLIARLIPIALHQGEFPQESLRGTVQIHGNIVDPI